VLDAAKFIGTCRACGIEPLEIGATTDAATIVLDASAGRAGVSIDMHRIAEAWAAPMRDFYGTAV
jgi:hypothetical protein